MLFTRIPMNLPFVHVRQHESNEILMKWIYSQNNILTQQVQRCASISRKNVEYFTRFHSLFTLKNLSQFYETFALQVQVMCQNIYSYDKKLFSHKKYENDE